MNHLSIDWREIRNQIESRELNSESLDFAKESLLQIATDANLPRPERARAYGTITEIHYWMGEEITDNSHLIQNYKSGIEYAKKGMELDRESLESNFWICVNYGFLGNAQGMMSSLFMIDPVFHHIQFCLKKDPEFFHGGPHRVLGYLYFRVPGWPISKGDKKKGLQHMEKAKSIDPNFFLTRVFLLEMYLSMGFTKEANQEYSWIKENPGPENLPKLTSKYKSEADMHWAKFS